MKKMLVVYNTCGLSGRQNIDYYKYAINTILNQNFEDFTVLLSDCCGLPHVRMELLSCYKDNIYFNFIEDKLPINITFNHSVLKAIENIGKFDTYIYVDSGINFKNDRNTIQKLYDLYKVGPYGIVSARTLTDTGYPAWLGIGSHDNDYLAFREFFASHGNFVLPVGKAVNNHVQLYGHEFIDVYGRLIQDIFAGQCTESVSSFLCAAIKKQWVICADTELEHYTGLDIPSVGFSPNAWEASGKKKWDHLFNQKESILDIIGRGIEYGMGYEEIQHIVDHNPDKFDENGFALDDRLAPYIKNNLFLQKEHFNYDEINSTWI